jgi:hypothetical protein
MAALAFPLALGMGNKGFASFSPRRTPPHHARVDLASKLCCARRSIHAHEDTTSPPAMVAVVFTLPPFPPNLCPRGISLSSVVAFVIFPPSPLSIVRSHLLQHQ